jgi:argininosuccinate lyase
MRTNLWQTEGSGSLHPAVEAYTVGNDRALDQRLLGYDIRASKAHAAMLGSIGVLNKTETQAVAVTLDELYEEWADGRFKVSEEHEDGHTAIELYLTGKLGDTGKKIHTGRSRNDQALVMMRLYLKESLERVTELLDEAVKAYAGAAAAAGGTPMPGYTHGQKAMPTTVATWLDSFAAAFGDTRPIVGSALGLIDQNPLGSAAGFGAGLPVDRKFTTKKLGFAGVQDNPMYCGLSRGLFELVAVQALNPIMVLAGKFANDMLLFTSQEFGFFSLPENLTTGSSIMPHKRNYDLFEIMRGQAAAFGSYPLRLQAVAAGTGSGYNRDLQLTKEVALAAFDTVEATLKVLALAVANLRVHKPVLKKAMTGELFTVAEIDRLVGQGVPFRDAYMQVKVAHQRRRGGKAGQLLV